MFLFVVSVGRCSAAACQMVVDHETCCPYHHNGEFWFVTTNMSDFGGGHLLLRAKDPAGLWSDPVQIPGTLGIDPDIAWDGDGNCYLTWVGFGPGENESGIVQARLDPDAGRLLESPRKVWQGTDLAYPEGPHLYKAGGWWYLLLAEGGTQRGHAVSVNRGQQPRRSLRVIFEQPHPQSSQHGGARPECGPRRPGRNGQW